MAGFDVTDVTTVSLEHTFVMCDRLQWVIIPLKFQSEENRIMKKDLYFVSCLQSFLKSVSELSEANNGL